MLQLLLAARERLGLTQQEMAAKLGVSRNYLALIETGKRRVPPHVADQIVTMKQGFITDLGNQPMAELTKPIPSDAYASRIADLERQLERANETIASQARTIEAMQQGRSTGLPSGHAAPTARAGGLRRKSSTYDERKGA